MSRGSDFDEVRDARYARRGVGVAWMSVIALKDAERGLGLETGGKSNDSRTGVETVFPGLLRMGVGGGISTNSDSGGVSGRGMVWRPRTR